MTNSHKLSAPKSLVSISTVVLLFAGLAVLGWLIFLIETMRFRSAGVGSLFPPRDPLFWDFYIYKSTFDSYHTTDFFRIIPDRSRFAYPPLLAPIYDTFYSLPHKVGTYIAFTAALWGALGAWLYRVLRPRLQSTRSRRTLALCAGFLYPAVFMLERGNLEVFVWAAVALGVFCIWRGKDTAASVAFGCAAALKLYPVLLLGLLLWKKHSIRNVLLGIAVAVGLTYLALWHAGPTVGIAAKGFLEGITGFQERYTATLQNLQWDHSLFTLCKAAAVKGSLAAATLTTLSRLYYLFAGVFFGALYFLRIRRLPWQNQLLFLTVCSILLPPVSYEYTVVHLYVPTLLLIGFFLERGERPTGYGLLALAEVLALLLPSNLFQFSQVFRAGQVQAVLLLLLSITSCAHLVEPVAVVSRVQERESVLAH